MNYLDRYELVLTEDGSPTFRDLGSETQETMHHRGGAYSETQLIYGNPLRACLQAGLSSAVSVGLGLGYNEILVATEALKNQIPVAEFRLLSFESEKPLRDSFVGWVGGQKNSVYDQIAGLFEYDISKIQNWLHEALEQKTWILEESLNAERLSQPSEQYACLFYDAFSSKTSPDLWSEEFLNLFFAKFCAPTSVVSTYACTGALKRSLKEQNFELLLKPGFNGKRLRTTGIRGFEDSIKSLFLDL